MEENNNNNEKDTFLYEPVYKFLNYSVQLHDVDPEEELYIKYMMNGKIYSIRIVVASEEEEAMQELEGVTIQ